MRPPRWLLTATLVSTAALAGSPLVVIDPGHGGEQTGAIGPNGQREKNIALVISKQLKELLEKDFKATVVLTREKDALVQLSERVVLANKKQPDLFISIHANSMPTAAQRRLNQGIETYFLSAAASGEDAKKVAARENAESGSQPRGAAGDTLSFILADLQRSETHVDSSRLAYSVHEELILETQAQDRGVQQAPFYVLMGLEAPAILVEVGFVSHPEEGKLLTDAAYQARLARAISAGVGKFLEQLEARDGKK